MKLPLVPLLALPLALALACGPAFAQMKPPTKSQPKAPLGSGLGTQSAPKPAAEEKAPSGDTIVQDIANCMLVGLPPNWKIAQVEVTEIGRDGKQREFEAKYAYVGADDKPVLYTPCDLREPALNVYKLNAALAPDKRNWTKATLVLSSEGKFELQYDYARKEGEGEAGAGAAAGTAPGDAKKK